MPIKNGQVPLVSTGAEYLVPQLASSKFIQRASQDGKVEEIVADNYVKVKYKDGQTQYIDITPRLSSTKRASYLSLGMNTLKEGDSFKKNEAIAWTNTFSNGGYSCGRNLKMALMNYLG